LQCQARARALVPNLRHGEAITYAHRAASAPALLSLQAQLEHTLPFETTNSELNSPVAANSNGVNRILPQNKAHLHN
jgi:hypothetical protein